MVSDAYTAISRCRICRSDRLYMFLDLGKVPAVNKFLDRPDPDQVTYPLEVVFCEDCNHVQLKNTVNRSLLFGEYMYFSSASDPLEEHFTEYAETVEDMLDDPDGVLVEIGCNDGLLLRQFPDTYRKLGVEPAENVASVARDEHGLDVVTEFFDADVASTVQEDHGSAAAVLANNVVGHIDDLHGFFDGVETLLAEDGLFVMEVPYLVDLLNRGEFDTIYHEHISYFAVRPLVRLLDQFGLELFDVDRLDIHGGSIRAYVQREDGPRDRRDVVKDLITLEETTGLDDTDRFDEFAGLVRQRREHLTDILTTLSEEGASISGYGAPAKGNVLLNYCDVGPDIIDYIVDTTPEKQGTYAPGTEIPVRAPEAFSEDPPDYTLLLAWNYRDAILDKERGYREDGGQFIVPQPYVDMV
ncbi:class I SAM-dependent methyltransferase [Halorubrum sp. BV1]|uniref:class I SAM-dependent methyltransferase n=1 Tax=Halorubrum sp. BV1 TaxID=1498500 RepID=UPI0006785B22|nr:class I SAM-dependent methyltransferase [Halorubrum sp. BV1]